MSDYLWDKKGEPDAEVARLETLLGAFAHEPRRLELPAEAPAPRRTWLPPFASRAFAPAALAAAAALLVASVIIASVFMRARVVTEGEQVMLEPPPRAAEVKGEAPTAGGQAQDEKVEDEKVAVESLSRVTRRGKGVQVAVAPSRRRKVPAAEPAARVEGEGLTLEAMSTRDGASAFVENARLLTKEQLVYALRLTGAKLRDVRQKAQKAEARP